MRRPEDRIPKPHVRGFLVDELGLPVKARVAVVKSSGSNSGVKVGSFVLQGPKWGEATLVATTEDGRIAWKILQAGDEGPHTLTLNSSGAFLELELDRSQNSQVAVFQDDVRLHTMTLHARKKRILVVPAGDVRFGLTGQDGELRQVTLSPGQRAQVRLR